MRLIHMLFGFKQYQVPLLFANCIWGG